MPENTIVVTIEKRLRRLQIVVGVLAAIVVANGVMQYRERPEQSGREDNLDWLDDAIEPVVRARRLEVYGNSEPLEDRPKCIITASEEGGLVFIYGREFDRGPRVVMGVSGNEKSGVVSIRSYHSDTVTLTTDTNGVGAVVVKNTRGETVGAFRGTHVDPAPLGTDGQSMPNATE